MLREWRVDSAFRRAMPAPGPRARIHSGDAKLTRGTTQRRSGIAPAGRLSPRCIQEKPVEKLPQHGELEEQPMMGWMDGRHLGALQPLMQQRPDISRRGAVGRRFRRQFSHFVSDRFRSFDKSHGDGVLNILGDKAFQKLASIVPADSWTVGVDRAAALVVSRTWLGKDLLTVINGDIHARGSERRKRIVRLQVAPVK